MESMYEILMNLPLFKGISYNKISSIIETVKFHFLKYTDGETVQNAADPCTHVKFIIKGAVRMTIESPDSRMRVSQTIGAPSVISPDFLFGRNTLYPATSIASGENGCAICQVSKADYMKILHDDEIFMFNFLNLLSVNAQKSFEGVLALTSGTLEHRIAFWTIALTQNDAKDITIECRHRDLYSLFGVSRSSFFQTLQNMRERGLIDYSPNCIKVISRRRLAELIRHV